MRADHDYVSHDTVNRLRTKKRRASAEKEETATITHVCVESTQNSGALVQSSNITSNSACSTTTTDHQQDNIFKKPLPVTKSTHALKSACAPRAEPSTYREKRDKNNVASQRSRRMRKEKFVQMDEQVVVLETQNEAMRAKIEKMEALAKAMREALVAKISGK